MKITKACFHMRKMFPCPLGSGRDSICFSVISKTVFQRIGSLLEIAKLLKFIVNFGIA